MDQPNQGEGSFRSCELCKLWPGSPRVWSYLFTTSPVHAASAQRRGSKGTLAISLAFSKTQLEIGAKGFSDVGLGPWLSSNLGRHVTICKINQNYAKWLIDVDCRYWSSFTTFNSSWLYLFMFGQFLFEGFPGQFISDPFPARTSRYVHLLWAETNTVLTMLDFPNRWVKHGKAYDCLERAFYLNWNVRCRAASTLGC